MAKTSRGSIVVVPIWLQRFAACSVTLAMLLAAANHTAYGADGKPTSEKRPTNCSTCRFLLRPKCPAVGRPPAFLRFTSTAICESGR